MAITRKAGQHAAVDGDPGILHALEQPHWVLGSAVLVNEAVRESQDRGGTRSVRLARRERADSVVGRSPFALHPGVEGIEGSERGERAGSSRALPSPGSSCETGVGPRPPARRSIAPALRRARLSRGPDAVAPAAARDLGAGDGVRAGHRGHPTMVGEGENPPSGAAL